jgi:hypothetical protein
VPHAIDYKQPTGRRMREASVRGPDARRPRLPPGFPEPRPGARPRSCCRCAPGRWAWGCPAGARLPSGGGGPGRGGATGLGWIIKLRLLVASTGRGPGVTRPMGSCRGELQMGPCRGHWPGQWTRDGTMIIQDPSPGPLAATSLGHWHTMPLGTCQCHIPRTCPGPLAGPWT